MTKVFLLLAIASFFYFSFISSNLNNITAFESAGYSTAKVILYLDSPRKEKSKTVLNQYAIKILGIWASPGSENASFVINKKKIYYPDQSSSFSYFLKTDSIFINYKTYKAAYQIRMKGRDTMILKDEEDHVYYRFKR